MEQHKSRISKMGRKSERLEKELGEAKTALAKFEEKEESHNRAELHRRLSAVERPQGFDEWLVPDQMAWMSTKAIELSGSNGTPKANPEVAARLDRVEKLQSQERHFRGLSREQLAVVEDIREDYPGVDDPKKLLNLAKMEEPGLFRDAPDRGGPVHVGRAGRGMPEVPSEGPPSYGELRQFMSTLPVDDPRHDSLGPWLVKAQMDEEYPGIHDPLPRR